MAEWLTFGAWDARAIAELIAGAAYGDAARLVPDVVVEREAGEQQGDGHGDANHPMPARARVWRVEVSGATVGHVGRVVLDAPVWAAPAWGVEISLGAVEMGSPVAEERASASEGRVYLPPATTPASEFDIALSLPPGVTGAAVEAVIRKAAGDVLEQLALFDLYEGPGLAEGHRGLAWRLTFRHPERTLRDKEIDARRGRILSALESELNVRRRTS
jgi:phenylalanyl-tRNA synthetase beta chain